MTNTIKNIIITTSIIIYFIFIFHPILDIGYLDSFILFVTHAIFIYICGLIINKKNNYIKNINIYYILYFIMLFSLTMFIKRPEITLINKNTFIDYFNSINLIPFKTIIIFLKDGITNHVAFYNIFGNLIALMPFSFLLMLKDDRNINLLTQIKKLSLMVLLIELLQFIFNCGIFDIDDFILNISGSLILYLLLIKTKLIYKLKKLFYTDFNLPNKIKYILFSIIISIEIGLIIFNIYKLIVF